MVTRFVRCFSFGCVAFAIAIATASAGAHGATNHRASEYHHRANTRAQYYRRYNPRSSHRDNTWNRGSTYHYRASRPSESRWSYYGRRISRGTREHRSSKAKYAFEVMSGHPHGWPGHVVDHIVPLACGGADAPANMQWQTAADGKAKDKWERKGCRTGSHHR